MERYKRCGIRINKEFVKKEIIYKYGSITKYCKKAGISRVRFWEIMNTPHLSKEVECLQKLSRDLEVSIDTILQ